MTQGSLFLLPLLLQLLRDLLTLLLPLPLLFLQLFFHVFTVLFNDLPIVVDLVTHKVQPRPFVDAVFDIANALGVEHVAGWFECLAAFRSVDTFDEGGEEENHVSTFVHDGSAAESAGDFARKFVFDALFGRLVPAEVVDAVGEVDVGFVEDCGPLEGCPVESLAGCAMTVLGIKRYLSAQLVLDPSAVTTAFPHRMKVLVLPMDFIWLLVFPLVVLAGACLKLVTIFSIDFFRMDALGFFLGAHLRDVSDQRSMLGVRDGMDFRTGDTRA